LTFDGKKGGAGGQSTSPGLILILVHCSDIP